MLTNRFRAERDRLTAAVAAMGADHSEVVRSPWPDRIVVRGRTVAARGAGLVVEADCPTCPSVHHSAPVRSLDDIAAAVTGPCLYPVFAGGAA